MKQTQQELSQHDYNSNFSFKACNDDKPLKEMLLQSIISDIDQNDFNKGNSHDFNQSFKREVVSNTQFDNLNNIPAGYQYTQSGDSKFKFLTPRTKFKSENNIGNNRMPNMNDFHQKQNYLNMSNTPNFINNCNYNMPHGIQNNYNNYPQNTQNGTNYFNNQSPKNPFYNNNNQNPNLPMNNNQNPNLPMNSTCNIMNNINFLNNPFSFNNGYNNNNNIYQQPTFNMPSPIQVFENPKNSINFSPFNQLNTNIHNKSKSSMESI